MQKQLLYWLSITLLVFNSCSNEEYTSAENTVLPKTLKTIYPDNPEGNFNTDFIYNGNKIVSIQNKYGKRKYEYDGDYIVKETVYNLYKGEETKYSETNYSYKNDKLVEVTFFVRGERTRYVYSYNSDGTINNNRYNLDNDTGKETKNNEKDLITLINGNIVKSEFNWEDHYDAVSITKYEYDVNKNAFENVTGLNLLLDQFNLGGEISLSSHNNIQRYYVNHSQGPSSNIVFEPHAFRMEYEYNKKGYPVKRTTYDYTNSIIEIMEFEY